MKQSQLFTKTLKDIQKDEVSQNAILLTKAGFIHKEMAGVYTFLPLGLRVLNKIKNIIREEMNKVGSVELQMTALQDKKLYEATDRWSDEVVDNWFKSKLKNGTEVGLGFTHEEPIANIAAKYVSSYKDLPFSAYQIQTKFRNESRAKAGIMRGREFSMKDLYSFSKNKEEHEKFYDQMKEVYMKVFTRLGIADQTYITLSSGQPFSKYSYEFQTVSEAGEDTIMIDEKKKIAINKEDYSDELVKITGVDPKKLVEKKAIEVGDIYSLGEKYSKAANLKYTDKNGKESLVYMGSYGMSPSRLMGTVVEVNNDKNGIIWPQEIAPFKVHLINLKKDLKDSEQVYYSLQKEGIEVLFDDREISAGVKFADSDLIGIPFRLVVSDKTGEDIELKERNSKKVELISLKSVLKKII